MKTLIMKFGGASVATPKRFLKIADIIKQKTKEYKNIVVVVSAMGKTTDKLLSLVKQINQNPSKREQDMLISVGERISISLLAMSLEKKGLESISFTGSQSGIITCSKHLNAKIIDVRPFRIIDALNNNKIVIVAGFQGVSEDKEITTLGRGGSDTSAVALAIALSAKTVEFYKDVDGIFSEDPKLNKKAVFFEKLSHLQAIDIVKKNQRFVLHPRCIKMASDNNIDLIIKNFKKAFNLKSNKKKTIIKKDTFTKVQKSVYENT